MSDVPPSSVRVALLLHAGAPAATAAVAEATHAALGQAGHLPDLVREKPLLESPLRLRGFTGPLTHLPAALLTLRRGGYDLVHAFSAPDAQAALWWRRTTGRPVVFGCADALDRDRLSDARLRLRLLTSALEESDAVVTPTQAARDALARWMAIDALVVAPSDAQGHARLYAELLA